MEDNADNIESLQTGSHLEIIGLPTCLEFKMQEALHMVFPIGSWINNIKNLPPLLSVV